MTYCWGVLNFWGEEEDLGAVRQRGDCRRPIFFPFEAPDPGDEAAALLQLGERRHLVTRVLSCAWPSPPTSTGATGAAATTLPSPSLTSSRSGRPTCCCWAAIR